MHSFHQSRGRILFEVFCALVISASCAGAWMQTGAWALLPAASVALLYGLVHAFDMAGRKSAVALTPQEVDFATEDQPDLLARLEAAAPLEAADPQPETDDAVERAESVEPTASRANRKRRTKAPRKVRAPRAKAVEVIEPAPPEEAEITVPVPVEEADAAVPESFEETPHMPIAPLFEPEPFVRQQRAVFGRKAG